MHPTLASRREAMLADPTDPWWGTTPSLPSWVAGFRPHQLDAVTRILDAYTRTNTVILDAPVGCLAADTEINVNRGGNGRRYPIHEIVTKFNGGTLPGGKGSARGWQSDIPTLVQRADDGVARLGRLLGAYASGEQFTYTLTTVDGRSIRATSEHPFLLESGEWRKLGDLRTGDVVRVLVGQGAKPTGNKIRYRQIAGMKNHPHAVRHGQEKGPWRVPEHRLVVEADLNDLTYREFVEAIRSGETEGLRFLDPKTEHVHHINHDPVDNRRENLEVVDPTDHWRSHAESGSWRNVQHHIGIDTVSSIEPYGVEPTFDLEMVDDPHNFIANEFVVHNSGKSLIAEMVRRLLCLRMVSDNLTRLSTRGIYTCTTISLQDQLLADFPYARLLKGRRNYPTQHGQFPDVTCDDCTAIGADDECLWCEDQMSCSYPVARTRALSAELALLNTSYFLTEANGPGRFGVRNARDLVILDEADTLESALMSYVEVNVGDFWQRKLNLSPPKVKTADAISNDWEQWAQQAHYKALAYARSLHPSPSDVKGSRHKRSALNLAGKLLMLAEQLPDGGWVYDGYNYRRPTILFKPVKVDTLGPDVLWRHGRRFLLMSGSVISSGEMADSLGIAEYEQVNVAVNWPASQRPVHVVPVANVTYRTKDEAYPKLVTAVEKIMARHPDERILVHTVSYALARYLHDHINPGRRSVITYTNAGEREPALDEYKKTDAAVLLAPSMDRGIDLPDDLCRVAVICKVPYLNTSDKQVSARMHSGRRGRAWYSVNTTRSIIQMLGRGMRHEEDSCITYILDEQFPSNIYRKYKTIFPTCVRDAIIEGPPSLIRELKGQ